MSELSLDQARTTYAAAFDEITARIAQWRNELNDPPDVTMTGAAIVCESGLRWLEVVTITDLFAGDSPVPLSVRFRAPLAQNRALH